jgi:asparagine synthase (glutamine-hydrolysing)
MGVVWEIILIIFFLQNHVRRLTCGWPVLLRTLVETSVPTYDNDLIDLILKIPPSFRKSHRVYRKFLKKLSPDLAKIPYNKTMVKPNAPLLFWRIGENVQSKKMLIRKLIRFLSKGKVLLSNKQTYVKFDEWLLRNEYWKKYITGLLLSGKALSAKYVNQEYLKVLIHENEIGKRDNSMRILCLVSFELFLRFLQKYSEGC